jgi:hypothetical protein
MLNKSLAVVVLVLVAVAALCPPALACNTPVYRYAMYNWQTAPYIVFYFYEGEVAEKDKAVHETIAKLSEEWPPQANVRIEPIDVADKEKMKTLPEFVIEAWKQHEDGKTPAYLVFSPFRAHVYSGSLDAGSVEKLLDSPARQKLGQLLEEGNAAVMILLTCPNEEQNKKADEALTALCKMADAGEIPVELPLPPMGLPGQSEAEEGGADDAPNPNKLGIAVLKVDRNDPAEEFFVRMLMGIEDDLHEYADQPMIFAGYGRGRAMEPYIGKGITPENLVDVVAFLAGACSCMVKEQNPGADLLVKWNWEATADKMAENDPSLDYGPYGAQGYGEFPVEPGTAETGGSETLAGDVAADGASGAVAETEAPGPVAEQEVAMTAAETASVTKPAEPAGVSDVSQTAVAEADSHSVASESAIDGGSAGPSFARRRMLIYGLGFGAVAVGVLLAGLALVLRRS